MPLHRDIFWVGKQWSVTGYGMQAIDPRLKGEFDIEVSRIWDEDLHESLSIEKWFNAADFDKGLTEARKHYPLPPGRAAPKARPARVAPPPPDLATIGKAEPKIIPIAVSNPVPANPAPAKFAMRIIGCHAKFLPTWRVRTH